MVSDNDPSGRNDLCQIDRKIEGYIAGAAGGTTPTARGQDKGRKVRRGRS